MEKTAVVLFNLGGPDSRESIPPFLYNFFTDPNIIGAPYPVRVLIAKYISWKRSRNEAGSAYGRLGYKSPLLENTQAQANALQETLGPSFRVFVCMRYWHPMADEVARQVLDYNPDRLVLLPLYPQFSTTTSFSSFQVWERAAKAAGLTVKPSTVCCYPLGEGFITASARLVREQYDAVLAAFGKAPRVLFSAHGLPEKIIRAGDPYQWQCEESAKAIAERLDIPTLDWAICYQSRVGPLKWIGPSTEEELRRAGKDNVPVVVYPHAFVSEHVETLVEIEEEYRHMAHEFGVPHFARVPTVGTAPEFIAGLAGLVQGTLAAPGRLHPSTPLCPQPYSRCCQRDPRARRPSCENTVSQPPSSGKQCGKSSA